ncbi:unnamed protein product [Cylindrotheca closterium]|uniref:MoaB/Mog domain-containing protein n=1 Tax=Cylindrotheca closterium TaxID=2856 RepID=A0AAD2FJT6_9STRA|nr:unnamed protein product [Cylindrotheca closterium]
MEATNYVEKYLPPEIVQKLEAGAFQSVCNHLRERSDEVQNLDIMTVSGFCRNCLAKWMVVEARKLSDDMKNGEETKVENLDGVLQSLDAMGYDEAAQYVYGMAYGDWKKRHAKKASDEKMELFNSSKPLWAKHDKTVLAKRAEAPASQAASVEKSSDSSKATGGASPLLSNVCCQDVDNSTNQIEPPKPKSTSRTRQLPPFEAPPPPTISFSLGVLTVSDRASTGEYKTGDLSGPAVKEAVVNAVKSYGESVKISKSEISIVPDEPEAIQRKLKEWADGSSYDMILCTGGTGFGSRDVTPEAASEVFERSCEGLMTFVTMECAKMQPLAALSRGTAGTRGNTLIATLPGNPKASKEIIPILLPLALHAVADMKIQ